MKKYVLALFTALLLLGIGLPSTSFAAPQKAAKVDCKANPKSQKCPTTTNVKKPAVKKHQFKKKPNFKKLKKQKTAEITVDENSLSSNSTCQFLFWQVGCAFGPEPKHMEIAKTQIGLTAKKDRKELSSMFEKTIGQPIDPLRTPWCAAWTNMVLEESGIEGTDSLMARSFLQWGVPTKNPEIGDIVILQRGRKHYAGHVGFFYGFVEDEGEIKVAVLGGNQRHQVGINYFPLNRVLGYRTV